VDDDITMRMLIYLKYGYTKAVVPAPEDVSSLSGD
jgi:hypothetical protein